MILSPKSQGSLTLPMQSGISKEEMETRKDGCSVRHSEDVVLEYSEVSQELNLPHTSTDSTGNVMLIQKADSVFWLTSFDLCEFGLIIT